MRQCFTESLTPPPYAVFTEQALIDIAWLIARVRELEEELIQLHDVACFHEESNRIRTLQLKEAEEKVAELEAQLKEKS